MLTLKIQDIHRLFEKENYTGKKIIDPEADELILEEALKRKDYKEIKIAIIVKDKFTLEDEAHFKDKFKEYYIRKVEELTKKGKRRDMKFRYSLQKGLLILVVFLAFAFIVTRFSDFLSMIVGEIAIIAGWVSIWKPFEYFIYERPDFQHMIKVCENLTKAEIEVLHEEYLDKNVVNESN